MMNKKHRPILRRISRREFLTLGGRTALLGLAAGHGLFKPSSALAVPPEVNMRLAATDGHILLPGREDYPLYVFGFVEVPVDAAIAELDVFKGHVQGPAPILGFDQDADIHLTLTNIGLLVRFDLDDAHTMHWHGFRNPIALFDGVPEVSIAVPPAADFPYFFRPHDPGTYMYHCHFEDVEHVQMGMNGIVYVRPAQNFTGAGGAPVARLGGNAGSPVLGYAYNDGNGSTAYDREFALMLNEIDNVPHDNLELVQEFQWNQYKPKYWVMNARAYPQTILPNNHPSLPSQPISSLIQVNAGDRVLLRLANLGYEQHAMVLPGIPMKVVGHDATLLRGPGGADTSYFTNTLYLGPGEARDVLFTAPAHVGGSFTRYLFKNRSPHKLSNNGAPGLGGMVTEVQVFAAGTLPAQTEPNQTYV